MTMFTISHHEGNTGFAFRVCEQFNSAEALISRILNTNDAEELFVLSTRALAVSSKWIGVEKCIPNRFIVASNISLVDALARSPRQGAAEAAAKMQAAADEWQAPAPAMAAKPSKFQIFRRAHALAKSCHVPGDCYRVTFAAALKAIYKSL